MFSITRRERTFCGTVNETISWSPAFCRPPPDFDARREGSLKRRHGQSDEPREPGYVRDLHCPQPESMPREVRFDAFHQRIALLAGEHRGEMLHHRRIRVHRSERFAILDAPPAQPQAWSLDIVFGH
jgi:hypothetical protein